MVAGWVGKASDEMADKSTAQKNVSFTYKVGS